MPALIRYATGLGPYYIARKGTGAGFLGDGFHWTREPREAHRFPDEAAARDMIGAHLPELPSHRVSLSFEIAQ